MFAHLGGASKLGKLLINHRPRRVGWEWGSSSQAGQPGIQRRAGRSRWFMRFDVTILKEGQGWLGLFPTKHWSIFRGPGE